MLFIIGSLVPVLVPSFLLMLEMFVGAIQAFVFAMLTMVFMSMATHAHGDHEDEHEEKHAELEAEGVPSAG
jgi:F-type H+-transporting ATPase subunit a